jgi:hypothetical protein
MSSQFPLSTMLNTSRNNEVIAGEYIIAIIVSILIWGWGNYKAASISQNIASECKK